jgi:hypothetical protein
MNEKTTGKSTYPKCLIATVAGAVRLKGYLSGLEWTRLTPIMGGLVEHETK